MQKGGNKNYGNKRNQLDPNFNLEKSYFLKELSSSQWTAIKEHLNTFFAKGKNEEKTLQTFFAAYPGIKKGDQNLHTLRKLVEEVAAEHKGLETFFESYKAVNNFIINEYMMIRPALFDPYFFPNENNEDVVVNMLRTCKKGLDICVFSMTNDKIYAAVEEVWNKGLEVRIITDDECCKQIGSDIYKLASMGIPVKTDDDQKFHMHHKFAVIDHHVVVTGSFNWTTQAVKSNQENIIFISNDELAKKYTNEFNKLWNGFKTVVDPDEAYKKVEEEQNNRYKK